MRRVYFYVVGIAVFAFSSLLMGQESPSRRDLKVIIEGLNKLQAQVDSLKANHKKELKTFNQRLSRLEAKKEKTELQELLRSAKEFAQKKKEQKITVARVFHGGQRQLQALNPNISVTGDFIGSITSSSNSEIQNPGNFTNGRNSFALREAEFHIMAPLDPFTRGKFFLGIPGDGHLHVGEVYMEWLDLPLNMNLKIGKFRTQFGVLNRWHNHALPQVDRPRALVNLFGMGGLTGTGIGANFLLPRLLAEENELDLQIVSGGDGVSFDRARDNLIMVSHLKNYYDLTQNAYLEIGFSGAYGYSDKTDGYKTTLGAVDLTYKWVPAGRSHYRTFEFRNEFFLSHRRIEDGALNRISFYSYISNKMGRRFWLGVRYSYSELPTKLDREYEWDISPYIDFWQSHFVRMRLQYSYTYRSYTDNDHSIFLQSVWAMGPHKHEAY